MAEDGRNAVTWGVFPGQEVVQTTIIERESFLSWKVSLVLWYTRTQYLQPKTGGGVFYMDRVVDIL